MSKKGRLSILPHQNHDRHFAFFIHIHTTMWTNGEKVALVTVYRWIVDYNFGLISINALKISALKIAKLLVSIAISLTCILLNQNVSVQWLDSPISCILLNVLSFKREIVVVLLLWPHYKYHLVELKSYWDINPINIQFDIF